MTVYTCVRASRQFVLPLLKILPSTKKSVNDQVLYAKSQRRYSLAFKRVFTIIITMIYHITLMREHIIQYKVRCNQCDMPSSVAYGCKNTKRSKKNSYVSVYGHNSSYRMLINKCTQNNNIKKWFIYKLQPLFLAPKYIQMRLFTKKKENYRRILLPLNKALAGSPWVVLELQPALHIPSL